MALNKIVWLRWKDASNWSVDTYDWPESEETLHQTILVETCGFLLKKSKLGYTVALEHYENSRVRHIVFIPKGMVVKVKEWNTK